MIIDKRIPLSYWVNKIKWEVLIVSVFSTVIYLASEYLVDISIPLSVGVFLGTSIALLLSFKLSQSYERWWEARKIWGAIVNDSRSFVIQLRNFSQGKNVALTSKMAYRQIAWCYSLSQSLRKLNAFEKIDSFISQEELERLKGHTNVPLALLDYHAQNLNELHHQKVINDFQQIQIDKTLVRLCASMGKAERIKNTAFPKTYRLTLHLFIYVFLVLLSLSLTEMHSLVEIPLEVLISIPFFLLEKIAFNIQDPFENKPTDTPMTAISRTIEINIKHILETNDIPKPIESDTFYTM